jgi:hypothetical protein
MSFRRHKCEAAGKKPRETHQFVCRLGLLLAVLSPTLVAQTNVADWNAVKALTVGTEVRITSGSRSIRGEIERTTDDVLVVTSRKGQEMFERQQVSVVSIKKAGHRKRNTLIGLAAGAGGGLAIGIAARAKPGQWEIISNDVVTAGFVAAGAIVGTVVGVIIPTGGWREVYRR